MRREEEHVVIKVLGAEIRGKKRRGRPNTRWKDACERNTRINRGVEGRRNDKQNSMQKWRQGQI